MIRRPLPTRRARPPDGTFGVTEAEFESVVGADSLKPGQVLGAQVQGREIVLCRTKDGVYALDGICTHAWARLDEGCLRGSRLVCPLHGASFDVRSGRQLSGPSTLPLAHHACRVVDGRIEVALDPLAPPPPAWESR